MAAAPTLTERHMQTSYISSYDASLRQHLPPQSLNQVTLVQLRHTNKATALIPMLWGPLKNTHIQCLSIYVCWEGGRGQEGSMSEAGILVQWWASGLLTQPWLYRTSLTWNNTTNNTHTRAPTRTRTHTRLFECERYKMGQIAGWEIYQGQMGRGSTYTCSKSHNLSVDKSLRCPTRIAPLFSIMRAAHTVIMNHWKWAFSEEVSVMPVSTISDVLSMLIKWRNCAKRSRVPNVPSANTCFGAQKSVQNQTHWNEDEFVT